MTEDARPIVRRPLPPRNPAEELPEAAEDPPPVSPRCPPPGAGRVTRTTDDDVPEIFSLHEVVDLEAREGDVLVVSYPEVTLPLPERYSSAKVGGAIYTRRLVAGESAREQFERVYRFLSDSSERAAKHKVRRFAAEMQRKGREG